MTHDDSDFRLVYQRFAPRIQRYLARLVGETEAFDLTQEVFIKALQAMRAGRGGVHLSAWLFRIATNVAIDRLRSPSHRAQSAGVPAGDDLAVPVGGAKGHLESPESSIVHNEMRECILGVVDTLPESYRTVILLGELQGLPDREVAEALGVSLESAKIRLHRARFELKKALERRCDLYRDGRNEFSCDRKQPGQDRDSSTMLARGRRIVSPSALVYRGTRRQVP